MEFTQEELAIVYGAIKESVNNIRRISTKNIQQIHGEVYTTIRREMRYQFEVGIYRYSPKLGSIFSGKIRSYHRDLFFQYPILSEFIKELVEEKMRKEKKIEFGSLAIELAKMHDAIRKLARLDTGELNKNLEEINKILEGSSSTEE